MLKTSLTQQQKLSLESQHKKHCDKREGDRIKVILLCDEGWPVGMIAQGYVFMKPVLFDTLMILSKIKS